LLKSAFEKMKISEGEQMEDTVIQRAQLGDQQAFQQLIEAYNAIAWRTARVLLSEQVAVEDVIQEVWLDVWRGLSRFQRGRPFRPWLLTIVANRCHMVTRHRQEPTQAFDSAEGEPALYADDVLEHILRLEEDVELQLALEIVSAEQRRVLELRFFADLDLSEIALITNVPLGTVKSRLHRALASLRLHLGSTEKACKETN
jgi:RNA polymerase sigma-70 factor, ECF subfamily